MYYCYYTFFPLQWSEIEETSVKLKCVKKKKPRNETLMLWFLKVIQMCAVKICQCCDVMWLIEIMNIFLEKKIRKLL